MANFKNLHILRHPLIQHKLTLMRMHDTPTSIFRALLKEVSMLMGYEITRDLNTEPQWIETPLAKMQAPLLSGKKVAVVPILRAGLIMAQGLMELMPAAREGHIGLYRDPKTKRPVEYLVKLPDIEGRTMILVDPMLATGYSAIHSVDVLRKAGVADENIKFLCLLAAPEGVKVFEKHCPQIPIFTAALDEYLDEDAYIVPGLGDAGDRLFGTK